MKLSLGASCYPLCTPNEVADQLPRFGFVMGKVGDPRHDIARAILNQAPNMLLGYRLFYNDGRSAFDGQLDLGQSPYDEAKHWFQMIPGPLSWAEFATLYTWAFGANEIWDNGKPETFPWLSNFESYLCDLLQGEGIPYACCGAAPGNVDPPDFVKYLGPVAAKAALVCADHYCAPNATILDPPDNPYYARRPFEWFKACQSAGVRFPPFIGKETGTYFSWKDVRMDQGAYIGLQKQYAGELYPEWIAAGMQVIGNVPFADGCEGDLGKQWNIDGAGRQLVREWNQQGDLAYPTRPAIPRIQGGDMTDAEFERYCSDIFKRANVAYNPDSAFVKYWKGQFKAGHFLGFPAEAEHTTENGQYLVQAFQGGVLYCAKADFIVHPGLPPFR